MHFHQGFQANSDSKTYIDAEQMYNIGSAIHHDKLLTLGSLVIILNLLVIKFKTLDVRFSLLKLVS